MELKKNPKLDYRKKSVLFFNIGLVLSLLLVISAFEWKFLEIKPTVLEPTSFKGDETELIEITEIKPPKPKVQVFNLKEVPEDIEIEDPIVIMTIVTGEPDVPEVPMDLFEKPLEEADKIENWAETMPSFKGGLSEFYKFVGSKLKYPAQARRIGIEGKVFVQFVVDKDGSMSDIKVVKGIGAGCDEEVLRILGMCPPWNPGLQGARPVRVRMILPVTFKLQ